MTDLYWGHIMTALWPLPPGGWVAGKSGKRYPVTVRGNSGFTAHGPIHAGVAMTQLTGNDQQLIHRISGIEGHVRSLKKLIGDGREPLEILMQISSVRSAIDRLSHVMFEEFVEGALQRIHSEEERATAIADIRAALETLH